MPHGLPADEIEWSSTGHKQCWSALPWRVRKRCLSQAAKDQQVFIYQVNKERKLREGRFRQKAELQQKQRCVKQHGGFGKLYKALLIWIIDREEKKMQSLRSGDVKKEQVRDRLERASLILLAMKSLWEDLIRGIIIQFSLQTYYPDGTKYLNIK